MAPEPSHAAHPERHSVLLMESTIPADMTIEQWRRQRPARPRPTRRRRARATGRRVIPLRPVACEHLLDSTTRYDHDNKLLHFLLVCPACGTEQLVETQRYEPRFTPHPATQPSEGSGGATVHQLPVRRDSQPARRAA